MSLEQKIVDLNERKYKSVKDQKIVKLLKIVLIDNEDDIGKICKLLPITLTTLKKYVDEKQSITRFINDLEYNDFKSKMDYIINLEIQKEKKEEIDLIKKIIDEVFHTRHKIADIYSKNFYTSEKFEQLILKTDYLDKNFGEGTQAKLKIKIAENRIIREKVPRNMILIQDRWDISVAKQDLYFLNEIDFRKLSFASSYLCSGADMNYVIKKHNVNIISIIGVLSDPKLEGILKPEYYNDLKKYISIEKILIENSLAEKKQLISGIIQYLIENNYDKELTSVYFKLPENLLNKIIIESIKLPYFDNEIKLELNNLLEPKKDKKVK